MSLPFSYVTATGQLALSTVLIKPKRLIGSFEAQVTLRENHQDELEITDHPIEQGARIADHAFKRPAKVIIHCGWSNSLYDASLVGGVASGLQTTVTGTQSLIQGNAVNQVRDVYDKLLKLQASRVPFDVFTGKRVYTNMLIESLAVDTDVQTENALMVVATLREVIIVGTRTSIVTAPASRQQFPGATVPPVSSGNKVLQPAPRFNYEE